jgi:hypothetical protein
LNLNQVMLAEEVRDGKGAEASIDHSIPFIAMAADRGE